jgi:small-conductance mechanosensitive channel
VQTFEISAAYGSDTRRVQTILEAVCAEAAKDIPDLAKEPPRVTLRALSESSVDFAVEVKLRQYSGRWPIVTELHHRFYERLRAEGLEIPFPTRTLHLRQDPAAAAPTAATPSR